MDFSLETLKKKGNYSLSQTGSNLSALKRSDTSLSDKINNRAVHHLDKSRETINNTNIELIFFLDKSGSCEGTEDATIMGFNYLVEEEKRKCFNTIVSTILFDSNYHVIHDRININQARLDKYIAKGGTALYDTLCDTINRTIRRQNTENNKPFKTVVVIMTDGRDESSKRNNIDNTRDLINMCYQMGWEFILLANNIDSKNLAEQLSIPSNRAENYSKDREGILINFKTISNLINDLRANGEISSNWSNQIKNHLGLPYNDDSNGYVKRIGKK